MYQHNKTIAVIGGDKRMLYAARYLNQKDNSVLLFGFDKEETKSYGLSIAKTMQEAVLQSDIILLPLPCSSNDESLNTPLYNGTVILSDLLRLIPENKVLCGGRISTKMYELLSAKDVLCFDYVQREEFSVLNAIPTAEGALQIAMENTPYTLNGAKCLVTGFGRIAKILADYLKGLGARVTVTARKPSALAYMQAYGYHYFPIEKLDMHINDYDIIFNTVPECILNDAVLFKTKPDALIIDLASKPGGAGVFFAIKKVLCIMHRTLLLIIFLSF